MTSTPTATPSGISGVGGDVSTPETTTPETTPETTPGTSEATPETMPVSMYAVAGAAQEAVAVAVAALGVFAQADPAARPEGPSGTVGVLGGVSGLGTAALGTAAVGVPTPELGALCGQLWRLQALAEGAAVAVALQALERGVVAESAAVDVADWVRQCAWAAGTGLPPGLAAAVKTVTGHARATRPTDLRPLAAAVLTGAVPVATATPLGRQLDLLARRVDEAVWATAAGELIGWAAQGVTAGDVRTARQRIEAAYATEDFEEEQESAHRHRDLSGWVGDDAGGWTCRLRTDNEGKAVLDAVFDALAGPSAEVAAVIGARPPFTPSPASAARATGPSLAAALALAGRDPARPVACPTCGARLPISADPRGEGADGSAGVADSAGDGPSDQDAFAARAWADFETAYGAADSGDTSAFAAKAWADFETAYAAADPGALDPFTAAARRSLTSAAEQAGWTSADQAAFDAWQTISPAAAAATADGTTTMAADSADANGRDDLDPTAEAEREEQQAILDLGRDTRTPGQRRHDALLEMARVVATDPTLMRQTQPAAAVKAQVTITIDYDYLRALLAAHLATTGTTGTGPSIGTSTGTNTGAAGSTATVGSNRAATAEATSQATGPTGPTGPTGARPARAPRRGAGVDGHGTPLTAATVRRMCCDAALIPAVLGGDGAILDWGRARRLASPDQVRYLRHRDKGCTYPGCTRPPAWTEAHHLDEWLLDHGETKVTTLALLCARHHEIVHRHHLKGDLIDGTVRWRRRT